MQPDIRLHSAGKHHDELTVYCYSCHSELTRFGGAINVTQIATVAELAADHSCGGAR